MNRIFLFFLALLLLESCSNSKNSDLRRDQVFKKTLHNIRLGDGVPLGIELSVRWSIENTSRFLKQFPTPKAYNTMILEPRERELLSRVANDFSSVDSVFTSEREIFIQTLKQNLVQNMGESGITIKEIIVSDLIFPKSFTKSMEDVGLKERQLETIRLQNISDLELAKARESKAKADGNAEIEEARVQGKIAKMNAEIERQKRLAKLAEAETEVRVLEAQAVGEAKKIKILSDADVEKQRSQMTLDLDKETRFNQLNFGRDTSLAQIYSKNPVYADYLINREMASKVKVAIIPPHTDVSTLFQHINLKDSSPKEQSKVVEESAEDDDDGY